MIDVALRVAVNRRRLGFAAATYEGQSVTLLVLPKVWGQSLPQTRSIAWGTGAPLTLCAYEGQDLIVTATDSASQWLTAWLAGLEAQDPEFVSTSTFVRSSVTTTEDARDASMAPLLDLLELFDRAKLSVEDENLPSGDDRHELVRLLLYRRFMAELETIITKLRAQYLETEDVLQTPRGRLLDRSLVVALATKRPDLLCRFDDHSRATDLAIVLLAAIRSVARYGGTARSASLFGPVRDRSVRLARVLEGVPTVDRRIAYRKATTIRLSRLERDFASALSLAARVLRDDTSLPGPTSDHASDAFRMAVPTEKLWEHILNEMLARTSSVLDVAFNGDNRAASVSVDVPAPWTTKHSSLSSARFPDFLVRTNADARKTVWCLDAKYKDLPGAGPPTDDANQLFVYSHLARLDGDDVQRCALIYPTVGAPGLLRRLYRQRLGLVALDMVAAPFPRAPDLKGQRAWELFLTRGATALNSVLA